MEIKGGEILSAVCDINQGGERKENLGSKKS
jgi:hypothetical protein